MFNIASHSKEVYAKDTFKNHAPCWYCLQAELLRRKFRGHKVSTSVLRSLGCNQFGQSLQESHKKLTPVVVHCRFTSGPGVTIL